MKYEYDLDNGWRVILGKMFGELVFHGTKADDPSAFSMGNLPEDFKDWDEDRKIERLELVTTGV